MVSDNLPTGRHHGAPKHGDALLAGLVRCRRCGRKLMVRYTGTKHNIPRYSCWRGSLDNGEPRCIAFGGLRVDDAIEEALLWVVEPGAIAAAVEAEAQAASRRDQVREALVRDLEAARYSADRAFRQYDAIDPQNRLIAAELELRWNSALSPWARPAPLQISSRHPRCVDGVTSSRSAGGVTPAGGTLRGFAAPISITAIRSCWRACNRTAPQQGLPGDAGGSRTIVALTDIPGPALGGRPKRRFPPPS